MVVRTIASEKDRMSTIHNLVVRSLLISTFKKTFSVCGEGNSENSSLINETAFQNTLLILRIAIGFNIQKLVPLNHAFCKKMSKVQNTSTDSITN